MGKKPSYAELEQRVIVSEKRSKIMTDLTHSWEYWIGPDSKLLLISPSCKKYTGYSIEEFLENDALILDIVHPDDRERLARHFMHEKEAPLMDSIEFRIVDRHGNVRWLSHTCQPVYDEKNVFLGRRASNWEITHQKQAEIQRDEVTANLKQTSSLLHTVLDAIPDVIGVQDPQHRIIRYNEAGYRFLNKKPSEVHGKKCFELIGHQVPCHVCATTEVYKTKRVARVEKYVEELDTWLDVRAYPVLNDKGDISQVIEHLRDISSEKKAEFELREAHERLFTVLNSIDAHIYVADMESYEILFMNKKMIDDFSADYVGKKCYESFREEPTPCEHCTNESLLDENRNPTGVYTWQCMNPLTNRWYLNYDRAIKWVDGRMVRIQIATDITEAKTGEQERSMIEQQLHQAQKFEAIGTLAGGIAHDFNNLMMGIQGRVSLMSVELGASHSQQKNIEAVESCVLSAINLTNQLLGLARSGKYEVKALDLNQLLLNSVTMFGRTRKEVQIHTKPMPGPLVIEVDQQQIEQVLLNLFVNAWQAMPKGGDIYVETTKVDMDPETCKLHKIEPGAYAKVEVTDTGTGMDKAIQQRIFDPFFTTKEKGRGTGLGLASAYGIIKNHGGIITVQSEPGHGATFNIYLPLSEKKIDQKMETEDKILRGSETILLVDDENIIIDVGTAMLENLGYRVVAVNNGDAAVEEIRKNAKDIDLVILDMIMPGMGGEQTFDQIREIQPTLPVILSSGYSLDGEAAQIMRKGCNGFIQKPFNIPKLSQKVREILDEPRAS